eukprot:13329-Heterococcus_DN1.PRE.3
MGVGKWRAVGVVKEEDWLGKAAGGSLGNFLLLALFVVQSDVLLELQLCYVCALERDAAEAAGSVQAIIVFCSESSSTDATQAVALAVRCVKEFSAVCCDGLPKFEGNKHAGNYPVDAVEQDLNARWVARVVKDCFHDGPALVVIRVSGITDVPVTTSTAV